MWATARQTFVVEKKSRNTSWLKLTLLCLMQIILGYELRYGTTEAFRIMREHGLLSVKVEHDKLHPEASACPLACSKSGHTTSVFSSCLLSDGQESGASVWFHSDPSYASSLLLVLRCGSHLEGDVVGPRAIVRRLLPSLMIAVAE